MATHGEKIGLTVAAGFLTIGGFAVFANQSSTETDPDLSYPDGGGSGEVYTPSQDLETTVRLAKFRIKLAGMVDAPACMAVQRAIDTDCDGTENAYDLQPFQKDFLDSDSDYVTDEFDLYHGRNDWTFDADGDGVIDAFDQWSDLNDLLDNDNDGIPNGDDTQPLASQQQTTQEQDYRNMNNNIAYYAQVNEQFQTFLDFDTSPMSRQYDSLYSDTDLDGAVDYYDTAPTNPYTGGEYDPYKPGSDAWYDDDNNGWDSDY